MTVWSWKSKNRQSDSIETPQVVQITSPKQAGEEHRLAIELRAVGQALEKFKFKGFKLAKQNGVYTVTGQGSDLAATFSLIHFIRDFVRGGKSKGRSDGSGNQIDLTYSQAEIEALDAQERAKRQEGNKTPDPYGVGQILRGVGAFLDNRQVASVLGISHQDEWITMLYKIRDGRVEQEKQDLEYFYDFWVKMYLRRSNRAAPDPAREPTLYVKWEESGKSHTLSRTLH
ncbi:MAG TPA: hypothetical protein VK603_17650 [Candidatus Saccharimonadales bacterium]|nr:hypothetical protein [Candidatus Saccharimonadales bacterium]